ncbi:phosphate ABC transporter ATP-binding protein [Candidatus Synechococcus calcipolaris G9]|uniref:Phosphate ABC transporter ATP-binding protein n=1 Tax=Candidatus Synechococcus calcipolaris G9 TaxID=1497997 RepID=A0ABT6F2S8_9SYNE|nr:phosphate ABC transporter ATP-binding protein [Candidatus Synechococcus calcipolaris]MDG2992120.1 phosphate ABC transporter ATP-binding protein [Candidatus Synechococcus calcipolaris G9]
MSAPSPSLEVQNLSVFYGPEQVLVDVSLDIFPQQVTALIGPSGCGKSTLLRCFNRLNDLIRGTRVVGNIKLFGQDILTMPSIEVRRRVGMVFQRPNPFPKSIYENIALGLRANGYQGDIDGCIEQSLTQVGLWDEVKNKLKQSALNLSGGQQQRLCLARTLALQPEVILMDEPCSALDPVSTLRVEELIDRLRQHYTIVMVTHNLQRAARLADMVGFMNVRQEGQHRLGELVEYAPVTQVFINPTVDATRAYVNTELAIAPLGQQN